MLNETPKRIFYQGIELPELLYNQTDNVKKLYVDWWKMGERIINHKDRWQIVPDPENVEETLTLDLRQAWSVVRKHIGHLSKSEQARLKKVWIDIQRLKVKKGVLKRKWEKEGVAISAREVLMHRAGDLIELFGKYKTIDEVLSIVSGWGYKVTRKQIHDFSVANKNKIGLLRDEWASSYEDFSLAKKRGRIEKLAYLAKTQMDKYKSSNYLVVHSRELRAIYEDIKKEVEGERIVLDIQGNVDPTLTIEANKTLSQVLRRTSLTSLVVSIVAAKKNIDPTLIISQLQKSVYAQFTGARSGQNFNLESSTPSRITGTYDWIAIEKKHAQDVDFEEMPMEVPEGERKEIAERKQKLLEILNRQREHHIDNKKTLSK